MGLEVVVKDVLERGHEEANRIKREGTDEADAIIAAAENKAREILGKKKKTRAGSPAN